MDDLEFDGPGGPWDPLLKLLWLIREVNRWQDMFSQGLCGVEALYKVLDGYRGPLVSSFFSDVVMTARNEGAENDGSGLFLFPDQEVDDG